ncbi:MAG: hypothetical protein ACRDZ8_19850 [Acidimicrobiales bacterium]
MTMKSWCFDEKVVVAPVPTAGLRCPFCNGLRVWAVDVCEFAEHHAAPAADPAVVHMRPPVLSPG